MRFKFNLLAMAVAALASVGAHAAITNSNANNGNSEALFVALSADKSVSLTIDLGVNMADFLQAKAGLVNTTGALAYNGSDVSASWDFAANARSVNGSTVAGNNAWSANFASFVSAAGAGYSWGVIAADNVSSSLSATNTVAARNLLSTANYNTTTTAKLTALTTSTPVSTAVSNFQSYVNFATSGTGSTHNSDANGSHTATAGGAHLQTTLKDNFGGQVAWSYLSPVGEDAYVLLANQLTNPIVYQLGTTYSQDAIADTYYATFSFDGSTLNYQVGAVPESSTLAMLMAGLGAVAFVARRRKAA